jgi:signal transduction histidine kinase
MIPQVRRHPLTKDLPNPSPGGFAFESFAGVPLVVKEKVVGVLSVYTTREPRIFTPMDVDHLQIVANHAAVSLSNEAHFKTIRAQKEQLETVMAQREQADAQRQRVEKALGESEERLRQAQKMEAIGQLAGGVAHDFNNILSALLLQTELVGLVESLPEEARDGLKQIHADTKRAADLTRQLLLFSRRQVMQSHVLNLNELIMNLGRMLQRLIREDVQLQLHLHPAPLLTRADPGMLEQVLMNLAVNARDAMPGGGRLLVETSEVILGQEAAQLHPDAVPGRHVSMSVSDTGSGIPPEILPRIFEPFFTTKEAGQGTGLGLATVFGIVKQHQGWIQVDNRPGEGVTFQIFLPATAAIPVAPAATEVKPKPRGGTETIFLVEDEAAVRKPTRKLLQQQGYQVVEAANGVEALKCWAEIRDQVALLFTDFRWPGTGSAFAGG